MITTWIIFIDKNIEIEISHLVAYINTYVLVLRIIDDYHMLTLVSKFLLTI